MSFGPKKSEKAESTASGGLQKSPKQRGQLVYEYICEEYLAKWFRAKQISSAFYTDATLELLELKKTKYAKKFLGTKREQSENLTPIPDIEAVANLPSSTPQQNQNKNSKTKEPHKPLETRKQVTYRDEETQTVPSLSQETNISEQQKYHKAETPNLRQKEQKLADELKQIRQENEKLKADIKDTKIHKEELQDHLANSLADFQDLQQKNDLMKKRLQKAETSVQELTLRLSKMAGDQIRQGNPNLADLSDPYRPTELGKIFSEIYDNEWSDAYEVINSDEHGKIAALYDILADGYQFCYNALINQQNIINSCLLCPPVQDMELAQDNQPNKVCKEEQIQIAVKDVRKKFAAETAKQLAEIFIRSKLIRTQDPSLSGNISEQLQSYGRKCTELSWFMVICDPPLALSEDKNGEKFKSEVFRPYTRSQKDIKSPVIEMTVWPALYLHEGGPLLSKGVAQPISEAEFKKLKKK